MSIRFEFNETRIIIHPPAIYPGAAVFCTLFTIAILTAGFSRPYSFHHIHPLLLVPLLAATFVYGAAGTLVMTGTVFISAVVAMLFIPGVRWASYILNTVFLSAAAWGAWRYDADNRGRQFQHHHFLNNRQGDVDFLRAKISVADRLTHTLRDKSRAWTGLSGTVKAVTATLSPEKTPEILADEVRKLFPGRTIIIELKRPGETASMDPIQSFIRTFNQNVIVTDLHNDFRFRHLVSSDSYRSCIGVPILEDAAPVGVISVTDPDAGALDVDHLRLLVKFSEIAAVILRNSEIFEKTDRLGKIDGLTGLYKRWYLQNRLDEMCRFAARHPTHLSVVMSDIDFFKKVNDTRGHPEGDRVLKGVAERFHAAFETKGVTARYGGEEFIAVLPGPVPSEVFRITDHYRREVESRKDLGATVSCGIASYPEGCPDIEHLVHIADHSLYQAKHSGRNRVCVARADDAS